MTTSRRRTVIVATVVIATTILVQAQPATADDVRSRSWQLEYLHIADAQQISTGAGVTVAVIDTGVNGTQPELSGTLLPGTNAGDDFTGDGQSDIDGHGTGMATLIAGHGRGPDGQDGVLGIAPGAKILPVRTTSITEDVLKAYVDGLAWAVDHGAKVVCLAVGTDEDPLWEPALAKALAADVIVVAGMGNSPEVAHVGYPAAYPGVVAVTATNQNGTVTDFSITGPEAVLAAPGRQIPVPLPNGYGVADGTSVSTAIVAGVAALVRAKYPSMSAKEVIHRLEATADDRGLPGRDDQYGYGIVDPVKALTADVPPLDQSPTATAEPSHPGNSGTILVLGGILLALLLVAGGVAAVKIRR